MLELTTKAWDSWLCGNIIKWKNVVMDSFNCLLQVNVSGDEFFHVFLLQVKIHHYNIFHYLNWNISLGVDSNEINKRSKLAEQINRELAQLRRGKKLASTSTDSVSHEEDNIPHSLIMITRMRWKRISNGLS